MHGPEYLVRGARAAIRSLRRADEAEFLRLARVSGELHRPWLFLPETPREFAAFMDRVEDPATEGFAVCEAESGALAGFVNINNIVRGRLLSGAVGYGAFAPSAARGYMTEGLGLVVRYAFGTLGLHRLEANIQPRNEPSLNLVKRNGFRLEGFSPDFLFLDGAWRDHERWAITVEMPSGIDPSS
jgi:[ribosomal protein S5]-alanine N-acetyltransferase